MTIGTGAAIAQPAHHKSAPVVHEAFIYVPKAGTSAVITNPAYLVCYQRGGIQSINDTHTEAILYGDKDCKNEVGKVPENGASSQSFEAVAFKGFGGVHYVK
jgi:hypothetical protein